MHTLFLFKRLTLLEEPIKHDFQSFNLYHCYGSNVSKGCSILITQCFNFELIDFNKNTNGRFLLI